MLKGTTRIVSRFLAPPRYFTGDIRRREIVAVRWVSALLCAVLEVTGGSRWERSENVSSHIRNEEN